MIIDLACAKLYFERTYGIWSPTKFKDALLGVEGFIRSLKSRKKVLEEFDDKLWIMVIETVAVQQDGKLAFTFKNGTKIIK